MIVPDVNLLVYVHNEGTPWHDNARAWWERLLKGTETVGIPWSVSIAFVRLVTDDRVVIPPMPPSEAIEIVEGWFQHAHVIPLNPSPDHLRRLRDSLDTIGSGGSIVPDAHVAALAMEHEAVVHSNDSDFGRFPGLRWHNPLS